MGTHPRRYGEGEGSREEGGFLTATDKSERVDTCVGIVPSKLEPDSRSTMQSSRSETRWSAIQPASGNPDQNVIEKSYEVGAYRIFNIFIIRMIIRHKRNTYLLSFNRSETRFV